jgi:hypothetical protein
MPLWKVYHPVGAFTADDKKALAKRVTEVYAQVPIPKLPGHCPALPIENGGSGHSIKSLRLM